MEFIGTLQKSRFWWVKLGLRVFNRLQSLCAVHQGHFNPTAPWKYLVGLIPFSPPQLTGKVSGPDNPKPPQNPTKPRTPSNLKADKSLTLKNPQAPNDSKPKFAW